MISFSFTAADASDNTVLGTLDTEGYESVTFMDVTAEVTVQISLNGTDFEAVDVYFQDLGAIDATAEELALVKDTTSNTGPFFMKTPCRKIRFLNAGAAKATVRGCLTERK